MSETANTNVDSDTALAPTHWEVTLNRSVSLNNWLYKPGLFHVVDQTTLNQMGDAVVSKVVYNGII